MKMRCTLKTQAEHFGIVRNGEITEPDWDKVLEIPEFQILKTKTTTSKWHLEKDMLTHTQMVCQKMLDYIRQGDFSEDESMTLMFAALFHDLGKCRCAQTEDGKLLSNGHPDISEKLCRRILWNMDIVQRERICELVRWHDLYCSSDISDRKLVTKISQLSTWLFIHIDLLYTLFKADNHGSLKDPSLRQDSAEYMESRIEGLLKCYDFHVTQSIPDFGKFTVYVMCGLPGSGKSTWVEQNLPGIPVVSRDLIREELGMTEKGVKSIGTPEQEDLVSKISDERVEELCKSKQSFAYDNMNSREIYRSAFLNSIRIYAPVVRFIYLEVFDTEILEVRRPEIAKNGPTVFEKMIDKMEFPRPYEYDSIEIFQDWSVRCHLEHHIDYGFMHLTTRHKKQ